MALLSAPVTGSRKIGSSDVAGIGMASVIHHVATQSVVASTARASTLRPSGAKNSRVSVNRVGPRYRPTFWAWVYARVTAVSSMVAIVIVWFL